MQLILGAAPGRIYLSPVILVTAGNHRAVERRKSATLSLS